MKRDDDVSAATRRMLVGATADTDALVRAGALMSLGRLGSRGVTETITEALEDKDPRVRMAAHFARWGAGEDPVCRRS